MDQVVPWKDMCGLIEPVYPKLGKGRPPVGLERMLRIYFLQQWFNLSDPAVEEALYESLSMRRFAGIDLGREPVPDETTVCKFRHLLEQHDLGRALFQQVHVHLEAHGVTISKGTIVDATIIHAAVATPANVHDATILPDLLHGEETRVWGDQAYKGQTTAIREHAPNAKDFTNRRYRLRGVVDEAEKARNRTKSKVRAKVEHCFGVMKRVFGFTKVRYRGLEKNAHRVFVTCALVNLFIVRKRLLRA